jgi:magnesium and cobalt transporter
MMSHAFFRQFVGWLKGRFFPETKPSTPAQSPIEHHQKETEAFLKVLRLRDVMRPRSSIVFLDRKASLEKVCELFQTTQATALPVFQAKLDTVVGVLSVSDCLKALSEGRGAEWTSYIRPALFGPGSMSVFEGVLEMSKRRMSLILVVDEYGGVDGWVCLETIFQSLLDHAYPFDDISEIPPPQFQEDGGIIVDARLPVDDLKNFLGEGAPVWAEKTQEGIETIGGFVCHRFGRVPFKGEFFQDPSSGIRFEIVEVDPRKVSLLRLVLPRFQASAGTPSAGTPSGSHVF